MQIRRLIASVVALGVMVPVLASGTPAHAEDPLFVNWATFAPSLTTAYDPSSGDECASGKLSCVDKVIHVMTKRFDDLAAACDHDALFALAYLRTTEEYRRATTEDGFFEDPAFVNHEDAVFAGYYFNAYDAWRRGDVAATPRAWQVALDAADRRAVSGTGNVLLGISAHINRDLPFVLADIGLVKPDGTSRKPDHDKVNVFLDRVVFYPEANRRFDSSIDPTSYPGTIQLIVGWREEAWRNAERLVNAPTAADRALVAQSIEDAALAEALAVRAAYAYAPLGSSAARDAYCATHWNT